MSGPRRFCHIHLVLGVSLLAALVAGVACLGACGEAEPEAGAVVLARVNGEPVTQAQVDDVRAESRLAGDGKDAAAALDEAIGRALVGQEAGRLGLAVDQAAVDERVAAVTERAGGEEALARALEDAGMSADQLRRGAEYGLLRGLVRDERFGDVAASDAKVRAFYRRHRDDLFTEPAAVDLSSILVRTERLGEKLAADLRAGRRFADLARTYSRDPVTRDAGGRLGWTTLASLPAPLRRAVDTMQKGEVAGPVQGPGGWFVLKLHERRAVVVTPFAEVRDELRAELDLRARVRALDAWIVAERKRADVVLTAP